MKQRIHNIPHYKKEYDLHNCNEEPLKSIHRIQEYGELLVLSSDLKQWHFASPLFQNFLRDDQISDLTQKLNLHHFAKDISASRNKLFKITFLQKDWTCIIHKTNDLFYFEFEPHIASNTFLDENFQEYILQINIPESEEEFFNIVLREVKNITDFEHLMIYQFDQDNNGTIIHEISKTNGPSYLGLKFPASDIPEQARQLYFQEQVRIVYNVDSDQKPIYTNQNVASRNLDLSKTHIRGVSPIHIEYLKNMKVKATFSVAIIHNNKLWGLIACHNYRKKLIHHASRQKLKFISSLISVNLDRIKRSTLESSKLKNQIKTLDLFAKINSSKDLTTSLFNEDVDILSIVNAHGCIVRWGDEISILGEVPAKSKLSKFLEILDEDESEMLVVNNSKNMLEETAYDAKIAGFISIRLSPKVKDYIIFTRKAERLETSWGGNPYQAKTFNEDEGRMSPRKSFEKWKQIKEDQALPWSNEQEILTISLRDEIRTCLYERYNELKLLYQQLEESYKDMESFSYTVSHDLKAPLRSIGGFAEILKMDYAEQLDEYGAHLLDIIVQSIKKMNSFIKDILAYSKLNRNSMRIDNIDLNKLIDDIKAANIDLNSLSKECIVSELLPNVYGDRVMINQLFSNLINNAIKYVAKGVTPEVHIKNSNITDQFIQIDVIDNGIGIEAKHYHKVFNIFQRLVRDDEYEGTGIGLAIAKKVVNRHGGEIEILSNEGKGSIFRFTLPASPHYLEFINSKIK